MAEIQRRYGDHLYAKHDYDAAMAQYVATIGYMEPSYVIRKFLDAQRIHNLTSYLEELHVQASSCYSGILRANTWRESSSIHYTAIQYLHLVFSLSPPTRATNKHGLA